MDHHYTSCEMTINGVRVPSVTSLEPRKPDCSIERLPSATLSGEITMTLDRSEDFEQLFLPHHPPGASDDTLRRRVSYGGRKGRSALRRLFERALPIVMMSGDGRRLRGKAVFVNEREIVFQAKETSL